MIYLFFATIIVALSAILVMERRHVRRYREAAQALRQRDVFEILPRV